MTDVSFLGLIQISDVFVSATCRYQFFRFFFFICFLSDSINPFSSVQNIVIIMNLIITIVSYRSLNN